MGVPSTVMSPEVTSSIPVMSFTRVVFPEPEGPSRPNVSALWTSNVISDNTVLLPKALLTRLAAITGSVCLNAFIHMLLCLK
ncbi:hypothetical protein D3C78_1317360 [compost metagenome]